MFNGTLERANDMTASGKNGGCEEIDALSLIFEFEGAFDDDNDPDRLEKTLKIFLENPFFFDGIGDIRPGLEFTFSVGILPKLNELSL